jgi:thymidylate kinase
VAIHIQRAGRIPEGHRYPPGTIGSLADLLDELSRQRIRYCSWKSNEHLREALEGRTDLDLLVDRAHAGRFREILERHGLKPLVPPPRMAFPGMQHYLGMDPGSGRLFHLHVHELLVLGERYVKNHHLPIEREFLDSARPQDGVPVPSPELELGVLAARALLKYRARDVVKDVLKVRTPGLQGPIRTELDWLLQRTTIERVGEALREARGVIPAPVACGFLEAYRRDPRSGLELLRLRTRLRSSLRARRRTGRLSATVDYGRTMWHRRRRFRLRPAEVRMQPVTGGLTVGIVGADGSGKSTIAAQVSEWIGWKLQVRSLYLGSKEPSRASDWSYLAFRALRRGHRSAGTWPAGSVLSPPIAGARDVMLALHHLSIGRDRTRRYRVGVREAEGGKIVIFDRFPLTSLGADPDHRLLDGPQIRSLLPAPMGPLTRRLARAEERIYRVFGLPDRLVVLEVTPAVAIGRKPDHRPEVVAVKTRAVRELATVAQERRGALAVSLIDADRPLEEVLLDVRTRVWDAI